MPRPTSRRDEVSFSTRLPKPLIKEIDQQAKNRGLYRNELIKDYLDKAVAIEIWYPFKAYQDWIFLFDFQLMEIVGININEEIGVLTCEKHIGRDTCKHIEFAKGIPYVQSRLKGKSSS